MTTALQSGDLIAVMLLSSLAVSLGVAVAGALLWAYRNRHKPEFRTAAPTWPRQRAFDPTLPNPFCEMRCAWLALQASHLPRVVAALGLAKIEPCSWAEGVSQLNERQLFVSPPARGWMLVLGERLPDPAEDVDECFHFLRRVSLQLGHVQFFAFDRVLDHHAWVRLERGKVVRAYAWAGRTLWNQGRLTAAELRLGLHCYGYGETAAEPACLGRQPHAGNTDKVPALAASWGFDPTAIREHALHRQLGVRGETLQAKFH